MLNLLKKYQECFAESSRDLGHCKILTHQINTGTADPIHQQPYPSAFKHRELLQTQVTEMLKDKVIEPSSSPWSSPVILVKKKNGSYHIYYLLHHWIQLTLIKNLFKNIANEQILLNLLLKTYSTLA